VRPLVAEILARAVSSSPLTTATAVSGSHYPSYKQARVKACYNTIIRKTNQLVKEMGPQQVAIEFPVLMKRYASAKSRLPRLDNKELIASSIINEWFKPVRDIDAFSDYCGCDMRRQKSDKENAIYRTAAQRGERQRAESLRFRIQEHLDVVGGYPVFWTLTADPLHEYVFEKGRTEFKVFRELLKRRFGDFSYCGVTERGDEGRLHMHCLFIFEDASGFSDPNFGRAGGNLQLIPELRSLWPYGFGDPVAVRFSPLDNYGQLGWRWPVGLKTGSPIAVALYMSKYVTQEKGDIGGCRTKMTRRFGLQRLDMMTNAEALMILAGDAKPLLNRLPLTDNPPLNLLRQIAARRIFGKSHRPLLPQTKIGSVAQAAQTLGRLKSTHTNVGNSVNHGDAFDAWELNNKRTLGRGLHIGRM
jgi:hypothetical protein